MKKISFVIPCYKSAKTIESVVEEIRGSKLEYDYEIILVNDFPSDGTWKVIKGIAQADSRVKAINFSKNFGQHSALMAGYRVASGDYIVSLDDDGQTPADETYKLLEKIEKGYDVVYASYENKKHNFFRNIGTVINNKMCRWLIGKPKKLTITSFFVARKYIIDEIIKYENPYSYIPGLVLRSTKNVSSVPVNHRSRQEGESGYSFRKLIALWVNGFTAFSIKPLRLATLMGMIIAGGGFVYFIYTVVRKILNPKVPMGWTSTISVLLILGGAILFVLGMVGEYLGRVYLSLNKEPQYVIKERINIEKTEE